MLIEDADDPEKPLHLTAGDVILVDEGTVYKTSTPSKARGGLFGKFKFLRHVTYLRYPQRLLLLTCRRL